MYKSYYVLKSFYYYDEELIFGCIISIIVYLIVFACFIRKMKKNNIKIFKFFLKNCLSIIISSVIFVISANMLKSFLNSYNYLLPILVFNCTYLIFDKRMYKEMNIDSKDWKIFIILSKIPFLIFYLFWTYNYYSII